MTGPEHFREAELMAREAIIHEGEPSVSHVQLGQIAQVHAILALAAATALNDAETGMARADHKRWHEVAGEQEQS